MTTVVPEPCAKRSVRYAGNEPSVHPSRSVQLAWQTPQRLEQWVVLHL